MTRAFSLATFCLVIPVLLASHVWADNAPDSLSLIVSANTRFSFKTFQSLFTEDKNVLLAPTGLSLSFALLDNGADTETQKQIENTFEFTGLNRQQLNDGFSGLRRALQLDPPKDKRPSWMTPARWRQVQSTPPYGAAIADSIWFNRSTSFPPTFLQINRRHYGMDIKRFLPTPGASIQISRWARERTKKRVSINLTKTAARSSFILVDVTHFHAFWDNHFQESATRPGPFTLPSGQKKQVFLMYDKREFRYFETPRFQILRLQDSRPLHCHI